MYYILNIYKIKVYIYNFYIKVALNCPIVEVNITNNVNDIKNHIILNTLLFSDFIPMNAYADKATIGSLVKDQVLFVVKGISTVNIEYKEKYIGSFLTDSIENISIVIGHKNSKTVLKAGYWNILIKSFIINGIIRGLGVYLDHVFCASKKYRALSVLAYIYTSHKPYIAITTIRKLIPFLINCEVD